MFLSKTTWIVASALLVVLMAAGPAAALYVPDKFFAALYTDYGDTFGVSSVNHPVFENITPLPSSYVLEETGITGQFPPVDQEGGMFERDEHQIRFATNGETSNGQATGHKYQRRESWDIAFDLKIESPNIAPRKEAGLYIKSPIGNSLFIVTSNDTFYGTGQGTISTVFPDVLPQYFFSGGAGPLGDYNGDMTVDGADYTVWRDTLGCSATSESCTDLRANGNNEGASMDVIDEDDFITWRDNYGQTSSGEGEVHYNLGDTLSVRLIYTPPELANEALPDIADDPNVVTPGTIEYIISLNGATPVDSGPLDFTNSWAGIPNDTLIMLRVQNLATEAVVNDSSTVTFSNFDFNGDLPGSGIGAGAGAGSLAAAVPEPSSLFLLAMAFGTIGIGRRRSR